MQIEGNSRNYSIDTLRTIAAILVVLIHVSARYVEEGLSSGDFGASFMAGNIIDSFSRIAVPLFVLISGGFLLGRNESNAVFYKKRLSRILIPFVFWVVFYVIVVTLAKYSVLGVWDFSHIKGILSGAPYYHLWYFYMLIGLYAVTPMLNKIIKDTPPPYFMVLVVGLIDLRMHKSVV